MTIEIGTSDFRTQAGQVDGIFIEPVKYYFDRLPECNKINCAISNYEGEINIYYLTDEEITRYNLPQWVRGCNSVNFPHKSVTKILTERCIPHDIIRRDAVLVRRIKPIIDEHNVTHIDLLKIDTEGHDCVILNDFLDTVEILPKRIQFESNVLSNRRNVIAVKNRLFWKGYSIQTVKDDIIATL
jgi:FkbM family methyltransferase